MKIKNLKFNKKKIKVCTSCILIATTTALTMKATKIGLPFYTDDIKQEIYNACLINSYGEKTSYITTEKKDNILIYYDKWQFNNKSNVRKYQVYKLNTNETNCFNNDFYTKKAFINELENPIKEGIEIKELITEEEKNEKDYWEVYVYNNNINNYIVYKEDNKENILETIAYLLTITGLCYIPYNNYKVEKIYNKKLISTKKK